MHEVALAQVVPRAPHATCSALWGLSVEAAARAVGKRVWIGVLAGTREAPPPIQARFGRGGGSQNNRDDGLAPNSARARSLPARGQRFGVSVLSG